MGNTGFLHAFGIVAAILVAGIAAEVAVSERANIPTFAGLARAEDCVMVEENGTITFRPEGCTP